MYNGIGEFHTTNKTEVQKGFFKDGLKHGRISITKTCGTKQETTYEKGIAQGDSQIIFANGNTYCGKLFAAKLCGQGTYKWTNGTKYVGLWADNKREGTGT